MLLIDAADWYVPLITSRFSSVSTRCTMVDLGATNVAARFLEDATAADHKDHEI